MTRKLEHGAVWLADLNPPRGTEPGKTRPVLIIQSQALLDAGHPSTLIIPLTTRLIEGAEPLRMRLSARDRLDRDFDMRHDFGKLGDRLHQLFRKIIRMRGEEADALKALDLVHDTKQSGKIGAIGHILAITIHDLAEERNLLNALGCERTDLRDDIAHRTAAFDAAPERDDAEGAGMRTTVDHRHMCTDQLAALVLRQN